jgi:hypothetical protein
MTMNTPMKRSRRHRNSEGITFIETLMTVFMFTLIAGAAWTFWRHVISLSTTVSGSLTTQQQMRQTFRFMSAEIRSLSPSSIGAYAIAEATASTFTFYSDADNDGLKERIRYFVDGTAIRRGVLIPSGNPLTYNPVNETVSTVASGFVSGPTPLFAYYDTNYDGTTAPLTAPVDVRAVRLIKITATIDRDALLPPPPITLTTHVSMRNLKDNL